MLRIGALGGQGRRRRNVAAGAALATLVGLAAWLPAATAAPPANDAFASAVPIEGASGSVSGTNVEATKEPGEPQHAGDPGGRSVWYRWTAPTTGEFVFDVCQSEDFDTLLAVYTGGAVGALTPVAANDDACALQSLVVFQATAGTVYSIAVDGLRDGSVATGRFTLRWRMLSRPANDDFAAAQELSGARGTVEGETLGARAEPGERRHGDGVGASIWYRWTASFNGTATIDTCGSGFDTILAVYTGGAVSTLSRVAINDDTCSLGSRVRFLARAGTTYRIAVDGTGDLPRGLVRLSWALVRRPANDDFARSRRISGARGSVRTTTEGAFAEPGEPRRDDYRAAASVWFRWRAPRTMGVRFDTCRATFDTVLAVFRGRALRSLVRVDSDDDGCAFAEGSRLAFLATKGVEYRITVDGVGGANGSFVLAWRVAGPSDATCVVPDVRGMTLRQARARLEQADCRVGRIAYSSSAIVPRGSVISQFPNPGRRLPFLSRVGLEVSTGRRR